MGDGSKRKKNKEKKKEKIKGGLDLGEFFLLNSFDTGKDPFQAALG
jgi:hypothetical protein